MIRLDELTKDTTIWSVSQKIEEMIYPTKTIFHSKESEKGKKLAFVIFNQKRVCYPTHLLFKTEQEAKIYGSVNFIKLYYSFDPFFISNNVDEEVLRDAYALIEQYEVEDPATYLYYWMSDVPNR